MSPRKNAKRYLDEELHAIKEKWILDKKRVAAEMKGTYPHDIDRELKKYLNNRNLQTLFQHAARLYRGALVEGELFLYPNEEELVTKVYRKVLKDGYYDQSKEEEKRVRAHLGKAVSRQTDPNRRR